MIKISDWMSKPVIYAKPDDSIFSVVKKMVKHDIGCLVVEDKENNTCGIITERDILKKGIANENDLKLLKVNNIMTRNIQTVSVDASVIEVLKLMNKGKFRDTPITKDGNIVGIITSQDLIKILSV